jgi:hypothetical protein
MYKKGNKYFGDDGKLLYTEGVGNNLGLLIINGTGSLDGGKHITEVQVSVNPLGLTEMGKECLNEVATFKLQEMGYSSLTFNSRDEINPHSDFGRKPPLLEWLDHYLRNR